MSHWTVPDSTGAVSGEDVTGNEFLELVRYQIDAEARVLGVVVLVADEVPQTTCSATLS